MDLRSKPSSQCRKFSATFISLETFFQLQLNHEVGLFTQCTKFVQPRGGDEKEYATWAFLSQSLFTGDMYSP